MAARGGGRVNFQNVRLAAESPSRVPAPVDQPVWRWSGHCLPLRARPVWRFVRLGAGQDFRGIELGGEPAVRRARPCNRGGAKPTDLVGRPYN
jgi:hypothetical protein